MKDLGVDDRIILKYIFKRVEWEDVDEIQLAQTQNPGWF